jgi:hypothetical protein
MNKNTQQFVKYVKSECRANGIKVELRKRKYLVLSGNIKCSGYFDSECMKLVVAIDRQDWLPILVHEFGHFTQWMDDCKEWRTSGTSLNDIDEWLGGKEVPNIKKSLGKCRDLELDNEKRSVAIIKAWDLPVDTKTYTQKANAYVQFYNWMYFTRRWCTPENSPYKNPAIYKEMPTTFKMNYKQMSPKYKKVFQAAGI